jgi:Protein of Unknown function (DUF2784)
VLVLYRWFALAVVGVHFAYLGYLVVGGFIAWRWPRTIAFHVLAAVWGLLVISGALPCPLTWLQDAFRHKAGQPPLPASFVDAYVRGVFYPAGRQIIAQLVIGLIVGLSWAGLVILHRPRSRWAGRSLAR